MTSNVETVAPHPAAVELPEPWRSAAVTVVIPTYNEAANLPNAIAALMALPLPGLRVLVADDNSPDGTGKIADELAEKYGENRIVPLHRTGPKGLGRAYIEGIDEALKLGAEFIVQMDADLSHPPEAIPGMLGVMFSTNADVVVGSRYVTGGQLDSSWGKRRRALSAWANFYVRTVTGMRIRDVTAGFKIWSRQTLLDLSLQTLHSNGYSFQVEMHYRATLWGKRILEVPIKFQDREAGASKMSVAVQLESAVMPFKLRWQNRDFKQK
ncbi:MAG: polyprenol monophosphomannose synthase [Corynebacteriales bacterium]|nr:polyprenol monophosphomannose synthase [Mycobacteriales bacterium]